MPYCDGCVYSHVERGGDRKDKKKGKGGIKGCSRATSLSRQKSSDSVRKVQRVGKPVALGLGNME